jgi:hypothetical protein
MNAGDKLLKTANDLLDVLSIPNQEKVAQLKQLGFHQTKQVTETHETQKKINEQKKISDAISAFRVEYPNYKYITVEIAEKICDKYNLVLGSVERFKGFVPQKNVDEILKFFEMYPKEASYSKQPVPLAICAPLKDMDMKGMHLEGSKMVKDVPVPDPVVLLPKNHPNGTSGYLILTAWGDEASDPLVVNQNNN